jgi:hypothetical protein
MLDLSKPMQTRNGNCTARCLGPVKGNHGTDMLAFAVTFKGSLEESLVKRKLDGTAVSPSLDIINVPDFARSDNRFYNLSDDLRSVIIGLAKTNITTAVHVLKQAQPLFDQPEEFLAWKLSQSS